MEEKSFMTYDEQIELLISKKLIISDVDKAKCLLEKYSYFNLINGYKAPFKVKGEDYLENTKFEDIYYLYDFDNNLRQIFIKYIFLVELHIKSLISYYFCEKFGDNQSTYQNTTNYNYSNLNYQKGINDLVGILSEKLEDKNSPIYLKHYVNKHENVPLWVVIKTLTFGNVSKMYNFQRSEIQSKICHNFPEVRENQMSKALDILTRYRNVCAHNERLFDFKYNNGHLKTTKYHDEFCISTNKRSSNLFEVVIALKLLLDKPDFLDLIDDINSNISGLLNSTTQIRKEQLLQLMGFPNDWERIAEM